MSSESTFDTSWRIWEVPRAVKRYRFGLYFKRIKKRKKSESTGLTSAFGEHEKAKNGVQSAND